MIKADVMCSTNHQKDLSNTNAPQLFISRPLATVTVTAVATNEDGYNIV